MMEQTLILLQLSDSAFPTGGFSHSLGLESALQHKFIKNSGDLKSFIKCIIENAGSFSLPFVQEAFTKCNDIKELERLDHLYHACAANHIAKKASLRQGKALADIASKVFGSDWLCHMASTLKYHHYAIVFGAIYGFFEMPCDTVLSSFMSGTLRAAVGSAVRLDICGPVEAQKVLAELQKLIPDIIVRHISKTSKDACITFPVIDILQNRHDSLFFRLFYC